MPSIKTAVSIEKPIFDRIDAIARRRKMSRSRVFALATEEFIQRQRNRELPDAVNAAHSDEPDAGEMRLAEGMRTRHSRLVQNQRRSVEETFSGSTWTRRPLASPSRPGALPAPCATLLPSRSPEDKGNAVYPRLRDSR